MNSGASLGRWIAIRRKALRLSQGELAREVSCAQITLRKIEADERRPSQQLAGGLAELITTSPAEHALFVQVARGEFAVHHLPPADQIPPSSRGIQKRLHPDNLPTPPTSLIGREGDVATLRGYLSRADVRLLTLTGTPGIGKTRLALQVATELRDADVFADGVCLVSLAPISEPDSLALAILRELDVLATATTAQLNALKTHLSGRHMLLVLDNFEHILEAAPAVAELLAHLPQIKVLVTSRVPLRLSGEHLYSVPALAFPPAVAATSASWPTKRRGGTPQIQDLLGYPAVELFVKRAQVASPNFALTDDNGPVISRICQRLTGLPLATELAAARLRLFSPAALLAHLEQDWQVAQSNANTALDLLSEGPRDLPLRQRTLRSAIEWSYNLLTVDQQRLFRGLGVFASSFTWDAALAVAGHPTSFMNDFQAILDGSLLQRHDTHDTVNGEPRFNLLEMIKEFALERLQACGEMTDLRRRHVHYYFSFITAEVAAWGDDALVQGLGSQPAHRPFDSFLYSEFHLLAAWIRRVDSEHDNVQAAFLWSLRNVPDIDITSDFAIWLTAYWFRRSAYVDVIGWLEHILARIDPAGRTQHRARLLGALAWFVSSVFGSEKAVTYVREALAISRSLATPVDVLFMLNGLVDFEMNRGNYLAARQSAEEWLTLSIALEEHLAHADALLYLGSIAMSEGDYARAARDYAASLVVRPSTDVAGHTGILDRLGALACLQGDYVRATALCREALTHFQEMRWKNAIAGALRNLSDIALFSGDIVQARSLFEESLLLHYESNNLRGLIGILAGLAAVCASEGRLQPAVMLWESTEAIRASLGNPQPVLRHKHYGERVAIARHQLDALMLNTAIEAGRSMTLDQAIDLALSNPSI